MATRVLAALGFGLFGLGCMEAPELGQSGEALAVGSLANDLVPIPPDVPRERPLSETVVAACPAPIVLYLNFGGGLLTGGQQCDDTRTMCSFIVAQPQVNYPAFAGSATQKQQIITLVTQYFAPFNVQIVTTQPTTGAFEMSMPTPMFPRSATPLRSSPT